MATTAEVYITKETLRTRKIQAKIYEVPTTHWSFSAFIPTLHQATARLFSLLANPNPSIHKGEVLPISSVKSSHREWSIQAKLNRMIYVEDSLPFTLAYDS